MAKKIDSIKHTKETRVHIPSKEEAGYEDANQKVQFGRRVLEIPKNPVVHRGQDPELFWLNKYGNDDRDDLLRIDIRSLYRHEHIAPETLIKNLYNITETKSDQLGLFSINELFGNALEKDELDKVGEYYQHHDGWTNRLIQGDSHLVMASLLEREGMAGQVQMMYFDPPYGINYSSNWQIKIANTNVKESSDDDLSGEPEVIKAFRDTWEYGIHSYLSYLRDRLLVAKELLNETGSCFVQISSQNVHLVRAVMDETFGSENFVSQIAYRTKNMTIDTKLLGSVNDFIVWYAKDKERVKYRKLYQKTTIEGDSHWNLYQLPDGTVHKMTTDQINNHKLLPKDADPCQLIALYPIGYSPDRDFEVTFKGKKYVPANNRSWKFDDEGFKKLVSANRIVPYSSGETLRYLYKFSDYPVSPFHTLWHDTAPASSKEYVVQTSTTPIQRCVQMTTDPGDLIIDPTCGSGTTAYVAETYGRRWITIDTSRIALNIAKIRLMTAIFPYFKLYDEENKDIRQGFIYDKAPHITLESITGLEPPEDVTLFDNPKKDTKKLRVSGPFTVETLQNFEPVDPEELDNEIRVNEEEGAFEEVIKQHLLSAGVKNGRKNEHVVFTRIELLSHSYLHAEGFYLTAKGEAKAYFHIGPKFGTVSKSAVNEAVKECRHRGDADWLVILGFSFESDIENSSKTMSLGSFEVTKARIHDDLLQEGLKKKPAKTAASFVTIGEPDIDVHKIDNTVSIEVKGLDIYDPIKDEVKPRNVSDIAYWMVDDDYDGSNFVVKQVFFCGGDKNEFEKWKKGLSVISKQDIKNKAEKTLRIEIDDEAFDRIYGHISKPMKIIRKDMKIAVRIISQFGEESTKVLTV